MTINRTIDFSLTDKERQVLEEAKKILGYIVSECRQYSCNYPTSFYLNLEGIDYWEEEEISTAYRVLCGLYVAKPGELKLESEDGETKGDAD